MPQEFRRFESAVAAEVALERQAVRARNVPGAKGSGRAAHVQKNHVGLADIVFYPGGVDQGVGRPGRGREKTWI